MTEFEPEVVNAMVATTTNQWMDGLALSELLIRFLLNMAVVLVLIHFFYYPKSRRRDYCFTFTLIAVSIFLLIFLMGGVKLKIGFALGLFAIFGIIRYRTESVPIREMTYLFLIIALSAINGLAGSVSYAEIAATNLLFIFATWLCESNRWLKHVSCKFIKYDKIELIKPERYNDMLADLKARTGLDILRVEVGSIDFLKDAALVKIYYEDDGIELNCTDTVTKLPKEYE